MTDAQARLGRAASRRYVATAAAVICTATLLFFRSNLLVLRPAAAGDTTLPAPPPMGGAGDLEVGVVVVTPLNRTTTADLPDARLVLCYLANVGKRTVRIYIPGLTGPIIGPRSGGGIPVEDRPVPRFDSSDIIVLRPGEVFGRSHRLAKRVADDVRLSAFYTLFRPSEEGRTSAITGTIFSDGRAVLRDKERHPSTSDATTQ